MKDKFVNDWGNDTEGQSGFLIKNNVEMQWHLYFHDDSNEIYGVLGLYDENGKNGVHFDIKNELNMDWKEYDDMDNVFNKFKDVIENKQLTSDNIKDLCSEIKEYMKNDLNQEIVFTPLNTKINPELETAKKVGHVQGVCECVVILGDNHDLAKKLMTETGVTKDIAKKYANPETYKALEQGIFAPKQEQHLEQTQGVKR